MTIVTVRRRLAFGMVGLLGVLGAQAQEAVLTTGGGGDQGAGSLAFSVGQIAYSATTAVSGSFSLGVQQVYPDLSTGHPGPTLSGTATLFPNPAQNALILQWSETTTDAAEVLVYNANGDLVLRRTTQKDRTMIDLCGLATGLLLVEVREDDLTTHVFHVIKQDHP